MTESRFESESGMRMNKAVFYVSWYSYVGQRVAGKLCRLGVRHSTMAASPYGTMWQCNTDH
jgi:hypothetical protein